MSHEIGHYINDARDTEVGRQYASAMQNDFDLAAIIGVTKEAEAAYNNWLVAREIFQNNGQQIVVRGDRADYVGALGYISARMHARHSITCSNRSRVGFVNRCEINVTTRYRKAGHAISAQQPRKLNPFR